MSNNVNHNRRSKEPLGGETLKDQPNVATRTGLVQALKAIISRLTSQPLLFGLGVLIVLAILSTFAIDALIQLRLPAIVIFVVGIGAWLIVEIKRANKSKKKTKVRLRAREIEGTVKGIEGLYGDDVDVDVDAKDVKRRGRVVGIGRQDRKQEDE
ncbi:MAG: hypothetical protein ACFFCW_09310 [Candidatus Hodarchaeota archaeon]